MRVAGAAYRIAPKLRPAGGASKIDDFHWAFRRGRRPQADSLKCRLGGAAKRKEKEQEIVRGHYECENEPKHKDQFGLSQYAARYEQVRSHS